LGRSNYPSETGWAPRNCICVVVCLGKKYKERNKDKESDGKRTNEHSKEDLPNMLKPIPKELLVILNSSKSHRSKKSERKKGRLKIRIFLAGLPGIIMVDYRPILPVLKLRDN
jgi:hypothetical protein